MLMLMWVLKLVMVRLGWYDIVFMVMNHKGGSGVGTGAALYLLLSWWCEVIVGLLGFVKWELGVGQ